MDSKSEYIFLKTTTYRRPTDVKRLDITDHQGDANQNHELSAHTSQKGYYPKDLSKCWQGYGEKSCWEHKLMGPLRQTIWKVLRKLNRTAIKILKGGNWRGGGRRSQCCFKFDKSTSVRGTLRPIPTSTWGRSAGPRFPSSLPRAGCLFCRAPRPALQGRADPTC